MICILSAYTLYFNKKFENYFVHTLCLALAPDRQIRGRRQPKETPWNHHTHTRTDAHSYLLCEQSTSEYTANTCLTRFQKRTR